MTQTIVLHGEYSRMEARVMIELAPVGHVVKISPPTRNNDQNAKMWAMLSDVARSKPEGRLHTPEVWKALMMSACGHEVMFVHGLDGNPFPVGFRSSRLTTSQMSDLIEFIYSYGSEHGVQWSDDSAL